ncbi:MAG: hypothetical protein J7474_12250, partial [Arthrobacter sp.]|nr:hypothetical protein [Arthrobacter sp.]
MKLAQQRRHMPSGTRADAVVSLCVLGVGAGLMLIGWFNRSTGSAHPGWAASDLSNQRVETLVGSLAFWAGSATVVWWLLSMVMAFLSAASEMRGRRTPSDQLGKWSPAFMRRLALAVLGLSLLGSTGAQAAVSVAPSAVLADSPVHPASSAHSEHSTSPGRDVLLDSVSGARGTNTPAESASRTLDERSLEERSLEPTWSDGVTETSRAPEPRARTHGNSAKGVRPPAPSDGPGSL